MELAVAALDSLLPKLGTLLREEYNLHKRFRGQIMFLYVEMECMQAVLITLSKLPPHQVTDLDKIWVRSVKELSYDIEDDIDRFMMVINSSDGVKLSNFKRFLQRTMNLHTKAKARHHIANDIEDIKKRIREVAERRQKYKVQFDVVRPNIISIDPRVSALKEHAANLIGTEGPVTRIIDLLTQGKNVQKQNLMVVSIAGLGGLGKTTIANMVYKRLGGQFDCQAFVSVSLRPDVGPLLRSILRQVSAGMYADAVEMCLEELVRAIREFLKDKRYFIVIDDVWNEESWKTINISLIDNNLGSRVIVTTRNFDVARLSSNSGAIYYLAPLSYEDSKRLLSKRIFNDEHGIHPELEGVTEKILKKCCGIPLAIITIASMLANIPLEKNYDWYGVDKSKSSGSGYNKSITLQLLEEITDDFSEERILGEGTFGTVYRGVSADGDQIAVKVLRDVTPELDDTRFQNEFRNLMMLQHKNIVRFVGYCYETQHRPWRHNGKLIFADKTYRALCFEYMQNGSLQMHLSEETDGLDWHTRYKIIKGTCEGLEYLHKGLEEPIYHLDLKPDNILLDRNMVPKLADFGVSKNFDKEQTWITYSPIGTYGYLPIEYIDGNVVSNKLDIYSLGVVMIQIIAGPKGQTKKAELSLQEFIDLVQFNWKKRLEKSLSGSTLEAQSQQVKKCIEIALRCVEDNRYERPNIGEVILTLNKTETEIEKAAYEQTI